MLATDLYLPDLPAIYTRFSEEIGAKTWRGRVRSHEDAMRSNPMLREHLQREHEITFALDRLGRIAEKYGTIPSQLVTLADYAAAAFAGQILSLIGGAKPREAAQLRGRVRGAFTKTDDMRGLRVELTAMTHFVRRGYRVELLAAGQQRTFDFLVPDIGLGGLEVECKSISRNKGRKIHEREAVEFYGLLKPLLTPVLSGLRLGLSVVLSLPERLPTVFSERKALATQVARSIYGGASCTFSCGAKLRFTDFDPRDAGVDFDNMARMRSVIDAISGTSNRQSLILGSANGGVLALTVQSARDDSKIKTMFDTMSDAARNQLSGQRAGMLFVSLDGIDPATLRDIGSEENVPGKAATPLRIGVSEFLDSPERAHLAGVAFVSSNAIAPAVRGVSSSGGSSYTFVNRSSKFWSDDLSGLFDDRDTQR